MCYYSGKTNSKLLPLVLATVLALPATGQESRRITKKLMREANADYVDGLYGTAWPIYRRVLRSDPGNDKATMKAAYSAVALNYPVDSLRELSAGLLKSKSPDAYYYQAIVLHKDRKFDEALTLLDKYAQVASGKRLFTDKEILRLDGYCKNAKQLTAQPTEAQIRNMGSALNSRFADYVPVIMPDESALYFTSRRENPEHPARNGDGTFFEDVYVSQRKTGAWAPAVSVGFPINTETNDACVAISPDGQRMIIYRTAADITTGDLYLTSIGSDGRWQQPQKMTEKINSQHIETSACFSNDTSEIYFSSDRPGGLGGKDLYRIRKLPNGEWSEPLNLGAEINTAFDDDAPFLHPDGITLYFSSQGHNSMGDFDVFRSEYNSEEHKFSKAENLGHPINDVGNDIFFVLSVDGQRGYYTTTRPGDLGGTDLYEIDTRFSANDLQVRLGKIVLGTNYGKARITVKDKETQALNGYYHSNPSTGKFILALVPHRTYEAELEAEGFETQKVTLSPQTFKDDSDLTFVLKRNSAP